MKLIVGLGNPGKEYEHTRHNIGWDCIDILSTTLKIEINKEDFKGIYGKGKYKDDDIILLKPLTYMNNSGESIIQIMNFFKINKKDIIVVCDDMALEIGKIRIRGKGSAGGHNGLKNIILNLGGEDFTRVKVGIGKPIHDNIIDFVLTKFSKDERKIIDSSLDIASEACLSIINDGLDKSMSKYN